MEFGTLASVMDGSVGEVIFRTKRMCLGIIEDSNGQALNGEPFERFVKSSFCDINKKTDQY